MPKFDDLHVKLCGGLVVWDGVTQPEVIAQGDRAGGFKWSLKCVFEPHNPDVAIYDQLALSTLASSKWRGTLPAGGRMPIGVATAEEFEGRFTGWPVISFKTVLKAPEIFDEHGKLVDPMRVAQLLYTGQQVDVLAHCYPYDAAGNRGISAGLDGFAIIASAQRPRIVLSSGVNTAAAFGGQPPAASAPAYQPPAASAPAYQPPAASAPAYQPPAASAPAYQPPAASAPAYQPPAQAHDFLPQPPKFRTPDGNAWTEAELLAAGYPAAAIQALPRHA